MKYEGVLLILGTTDKCNRKFADDCAIEFPDKVPVIYNFQRDIDNVLGSAEIRQDDGDLHCEVTFTNDAFTDTEYYVGGSYDNVKAHIEDNIMVIDSCRLIGMGVIPDMYCADENLKIKRKEE